MGRPKSSDPMVTVSARIPTSLKDRVISTGISEWGEYLRDLIQQDINSRSEDPRMVRKKQVQAMLDQYVNEDPGLIRQYQRDAEMTENILIAKGLMDSIDLTISEIGEYMTKKGVKFE